MTESCQAFSNIFKACLPSLGDMPSSLLLGGGGGACICSSTSWNSYPQDLRKMGFFLLFWFSSNVSHTKNLSYSLSVQCSTLTARHAFQSLCCITCPVFAHSTSCNLVLPYSLAALLCYTIHESGGSAGLVSAIARGAPDRYSLNVCWARKKIWNPSWSPSFSAYRLGHSGLDSSFHVESQLTKGSDNWTFNECYPVVSGFLMMPQSWGQNILQRDFI